MRKKLTAEEKKERKERKRRIEIKKQINSQCSIIGFHRLFAIEGDDGTIKEREVKEARRKIVELEKQL